MIKITSNFDSRKFQRELEQAAQSASENAVRDKLKHLTSKGLRISFRSGMGDNLKATLSGSEELIKEAEYFLGK